MAETTISNDGLIIVADDQYSWIAYEVDLYEALDDLDIRKEYLFEVNHDVYYMDSDEYQKVCDTVETYCDHNDITDEQWETLPAFQYAAQYDCWY